MILKIEVLTDSQQLSDEDRQRVEAAAREAVIDGLGQTFWYREGKSFDYEVSSEWVAS